MPFAQKVGGRAFPSVTRMGDAGIADPARALGVAKRATRQAGGGATWRAEREADGLIDMASRLWLTGAGHTSNWLRFGFVFQGRVIVFNNLLASFVHLTSFTYFPPPAPRLRSRHADPALREKHLATRRVRGGRGSPFAPVQNDWRPASAARLLGGPWCRHAFLLSSQIS